MNALIFVGSLLISACQGAYPGIPGYGHPQLAGPHSAPLLKYDPPAPVGHDGRVIDTPEVAQAKLSHFEEFAKAAARAREADKNSIHGAYPGEARPSYESYPSVGPSRAHYQRPAFVAPSYQHSEPAGYAAPAAYSGHYEFGQGHQVQYPSYAPVSAGPKNYVGLAKENFAPAPLAEDGTVVDTPEVAALKDLRLRELADAEARAYKYNGPEEYQEPQPQHYAGAPVESPGNYHGHLGASSSIGRAFPSPNAFPNFAGSAPFNKFQSQIYQPHSYQSQQLIGHY